MSTIPVAAQTSGSGSGLDIQAALKLVESGPQPAADVARKAMSGHLLAGYLDYVALRRRLSTASASDVHDFLQKHADLPVAVDLRQAWLRQLAARGDWKQFRVDYAGEQDQSLQCHSLTARSMVGVNDGLLDEMENVWRNGHSLPDACDQVFALLKKHGRLDNDLRLQRIALAAEEGNTGLMRFLAKPLPPDINNKIDAYADYLDRPSVAAAQWSALPLARKVAVIGLKKLARRDPGQAEALLTRIGHAMKFGKKSRGAVLHDIALWSAVSYLPDAQRRLAAVPAASWDDQLHTWAAREALARGNYQATIAAIDRMPEALRADTRWRYLKAHLLDLTGQQAAAKVQLAELATRPDFYGFLAADRLDQPYALCPIGTPTDAATRTRVAAYPGLQRALALYRIDRLTWARREWSQAANAMDETDRRMAVAIADAEGWHDRAVFYLREGDDLRLYDLRFPLAFDAHLRKAAAQRGLDPAWVAALIRSESAWMPDVRSAANAHGLMQLLPAVGKRVAGKLGISWSGEQTLHQPETNITLGTEHLRSELDAFKQQPMAATAAYNAGPTPVQRWQSQRSTSDPALWIETIPYFETRDYVARVFAFSVIYDWRLNGDALPLTARLSGNLTAARRPVVCPTPVAAASVDKKSTSSSALIP